MRETRGGGDAGRGEGGGRRDAETEGRRGRQANSIYMETDVFFV